jgi:hypothetical protein
LETDIASGIVRARSTYGKEKPGDSSEKSADGRMAAEAADQFDEDHSGKTKPS